MLTHLTVPVAAGSSYNERSSLIDAASALMLALSRLYRAKTYASVCRDQLGAADAICQVHHGVVHSVPLFGVDIHRRRLGHQGRKYVTRALRVEAMYVCVCVCVSVSCAIIRVTTYAALCRDVHDTRRGAVLLGLLGPLRRGRTCYVRTRTHIHTFTFTWSQWAFASG